MILGAFAAIIVTVPEMSFLGTVEAQHGIMKTSHKRRLAKTRPTSVLGTVPPRWAPYKTRRDREYLTPKEVERLIDAAKKRGRRYGLRDATMILVAFRHGLRVVELCSLTWDQIDFRKACCTCGD